MQRILARKAKKAGDDAEPESEQAGVRRRWVRSPGEARGQRQQQRPEERVEHGFLDERVQEDGGCVQREHRAGGDAHAAIEEPAAGEIGNATREGAEQGLHHANRPHVVAEQHVQDRKEVRIERRLVEDPILLLDQSPEAMTCAQSS
jgi:hypothetical protein